MTDKLEGQARRDAIADLEPLGWAEAKGRDAITKTFRFKDFTQAWGWMSRVALIAERMDHHPDWTNVYNRVEVTLTTHSAGGISELDVKLAREIST